MREIRFRGYYEVSKSWVYGDLLHLERDFKKVTVILDWTSEPHQKEVKQESVGEFTGLHDKNGKEIYEGDLLRYATSDGINFTAFEVFFHDGDANSDYNIGFSMSRAHFHGNIAGHHIPSLKPKTTKQMEVIGNIYQKPELL